VHTVCARFFFGPRAFVSGCSPERRLTVEWEFSADQVASGEVSYSLEEFRKDYYEEIKANFPEFDGRDTDRMFRVAYDVCYCAATNRELCELVDHLRTKGISSDVEYLELIRSSNLENIVMLKAIFAAAVSAYLRQGLSSREAVQKLDEYHKSTISDF